MNYDVTHAIGENMIMLYVCFRRNLRCMLIFMGDCLKVLTHSGGVEFYQQYFLPQLWTFIAYSVKSKKLCCGQVAVVGKSTNAPHTYLNDSVND